MTDEAPAVGAPAPPLRLSTTDDDIFDLRSKRGEFVVVSFLRHAG